MTCGCSRGKEARGGRRGGAKTTVVPVGRGDFAEISGETTKSFVHTKKNPHLAQLPAMCGSATPVPLYFDEGIMVFGDKKFSAVFSKAFAVSSAYYSPENIY